MKLLLVLAQCGLVLGHGHLTWPPGRHGGSLELGGLCTNGACYWFTNNVEIDVPESLAFEDRSMKVKPGSGVADVYKTSPWRAPGAAKTLGNGCGVNGGGPTLFANGGQPQRGIKQGVDGTLLPKSKPTVWQLGSTVDVAWALSANHAGGYTYRLCKDDGAVTEECFQANTLKFATNVSWIWYPNGTKIEIPMHKVTNGTYPSGSEWARDPVPACYECDPYEQCGAPINPPTPGYPKENKWNDQVNCYGACAGSVGSKTNPNGFCPGETQFPAPSKYTGFGKYLWEWSIMDKVIIPDSLDAGNYLLSWRWDCEESTQVWQNCADVILTGSDKDEIAAAEKLAADFKPSPLAKELVGEADYTGKGTKTQSICKPGSAMTTDAKAVAGHTCMVGGAKAGSGAKKADGAKAADGAKNPDGFKAGDGAWGAWGDNSTADDANCKAKGGAMEPYLCSAIQTLTNDKLTPTWAKACCVVDQCAQQTDEGACNKKKDDAGCAWWAPKSVCYKAGAKTAAKKPATTVDCSAMTAKGEGVCAKNTACAWYSGGTKGKAMCYEKKADKSSAGAKDPAATGCGRFATSTECQSFAPKCKWYDAAAKSVCYEPGAKKNPAQQTGGNSTTAAAATTDVIARAGAGNATTTAGPDASAAATFSNFVSVAVCVLLSAVAALA